MRWATAALIFAFAAMACSQPQPLITRERAIELATAQAPTDATFEGAALVQLRQFGDAPWLSGRSLDDQAWAVLFRWRLAGPCPSAAPGTTSVPCPHDVPATITLVLDARTGDVLSNSGPIP